MSFKACIVIPIYNHGAIFEKMAADLVALGYVIYIVDDGSDHFTKNILHALQLRHPLIRVVYLPVNQGKGAAVMRGFKTAYADGFTHALQIDADGQHAIQDVSKFMAVAAGHPAAIVCGQPIYDASVPKGRLYGRYFSHLWVWIETLSFDIKDSMCGFRVYPLEPTVSLMGKVQLPYRMAFDTEIVVRLAWQGVEVKNIPTPVVYPEDGLSHFRMLKDNLSISSMHARLFFGMLRRLPALIHSKLTAFQSAHWATMKERGSVVGMRFFVQSHRCLGPQVTAWLLHVVVAYYFITSPKSRSASRQFLQRVFNRNGAPEPSWYDSYCHMHAFAESAMDKFSAWDSNPIWRERVFENQSDLDALIESRRGALLIGSHLGNLEVMRALALHKHNLTIHAVVNTTHAQRFQEIMQSTGEHFKQNQFEVDAIDPGTAIVLKEKIDQGEWVAIVGDRTPTGASGRVVAANFLGEQALFAQGPILLASLLECPVYLFFCVKKNDQYNIVFEKFAEKIELRRGARTKDVQTWVQRYADRLAIHAAATPLQWFNFFDFWQPGQTVHQQQAEKASIS